MIRVYLLLIVAFALSQCGEDQGSLPASLNPVDKDKALVTNLTTNLVQTRFNTLKSTFVDFDIAASRACSRGQEPLAVAELQAAWRDSMMAFHQMDVLNYGPLAENAGKSVRGALWEVIYSWPTVNPGTVDRQIERAKDKQGEYKVSLDKFSRNGLDALEYILFERLKDTEAITYKSAECPYIPILTFTMVDVAYRLDEKFQTKEVLTLSDKTTVKQYREVIKRMVASLKYMEDMFQRRKVEAPLGMSEKHKCPDDNPNCFSKYLEHPYAKFAREALIANVESLNELYTGGEDGFGFQDYLFELGEKNAAQQMGQEINQLLTELKAMPEGEGFYQAVAEFNPANCGPNTLCSIQKRTKKIADWIKSDFIVLMSKEVPLGVQGDND